MLRRGGAGRGITSRLVWDVGLSELPVGLQVERLSRQPDMGVWKVPGELWAGDSSSSKKVGAKQMPGRVSPYWQAAVGKQYPQGRLQMKWVCRRN